jgi:hypothetical protein
VLDRDIPVLEPNYFLYLLRQGLNNFLQLRSPTRFDLESNRLPVESDVSMIVRVSHQGLKPWSLRFPLVYPVRDSHPGRSCLPFFRIWTVEQDLRRGMQTCAVSCRSRRVIGL